ncbi:hypothetical protein [Phenylobacterium sp.]|jgi:hypothetical protein|uniref:hypothetical protein n=1 Tax=Phenylobacterium sp. TaxID=1871053 RepID=UPI002F93D030
MSEARGQTPGGGTNSRPLDETVAETGPGVPDDSVGPEQRTIPEQMDLVRAPEAEAMARKLAQEAASWRGEAEDEEAAAADPRGHA